MHGSHDQGTLLPSGQTAMRKAIRQTLGILEDDIRHGRNVSRLPEELARAMLANLGDSYITEEVIEGDVVG